MQGAIAPLALIGLGAVGMRLAAAFTQAGLPCRTHSRSQASRERGRAQGLAVDDDLAHALEAARCVVICVPAHAIAGVAEDLVPLLARVKSRPVVLHTSGGAGLAPLAALRAVGCAVGSLHPLAAFAPQGPGPQLERAWFAIDGDEVARACAQALVDALGAQALWLRDVPDAALRYHAAASLLSNGTVALASLALELAGEACEHPEQARRAFVELLAGSVDNLRDRSSERALTGPVARGESATLRAHLELLADRPRALEVYRALSRQMLALAQRDGRLDANAASAIARELDL